MKCITCGKKIEKDEGDVCETCFSVLKHKYPNEKKLKRRLKCHKEQTKKLKKR